MAPPNEAASVAPLMRAPAGAGPAPRPEPALNLSDPT